MRDLHPLQDYTLTPIMLKTWHEGLRVAVSSSGFRDDVISAPSFPPSVPPSFLPFFFFFHLQKISGTLGSTQTLLSFHRMLTFHGLQMDLPRLYSRSTISFSESGRIASKPGSSCRSRGILCTLLLIYEVPLLPGCSPCVAPFL